MSSLLASFGCPGSEFHPVPWWAWNGRLTKEGMCRQLDKMLQQGIYEFFIFALYGLEHPVFLQESWFEYIGFTLAECRRRGMKVWIYDVDCTALPGWAVRSIEYRSWRDQPAVDLQPEATTGAHAGYALPGRRDGDPGATPSGTTSGETTGAATLMLVLKTSATATSIAGAWLAPDVVPFS